MPTGIQVINDSGIVQIDQDYFNLEMTQTGTVTPAAYQYATSTSSTTSTTIYVAAIVVTNATTPMIAIQSSNPTMHFYTTISGSTWTFYIACLNLSSSSTIKYWIFDIPTSTVPTGGGFEVRTSTGALAFHSGKNYLRIVGGVGTYTAGRQYAVIQNSNKVRQTETFVSPSPDNTYSYNRYHDNYTVVNNVISSSEQQWIFNEELIPGFRNDSLPTGPASQVIVVDVTNY